MENISKAALIVLVAIIAVAFFLPWVSVQSKAAGAVTEILTGKRQEKIDAISAYSVPVMANSNESRLMISIIKIFNPKIENADKKSYLIWSIPLLAVVILILNLVLGKNRWLNLIVGILGIAIFAVAVYKIKTTDLDKLVLQITIGTGLWLTLWSYLGIGILSIVNFIQLTTGKK
ncbi:MAG: hypothetical protein JW734_04525 [Candidatus Omnitrophica bacterium]|nr:hypothetical protein [Candidatus Omnitrophota bacterium]